MKITSFWAFPFFARLPSPQANLQFAFVMFHVPLQLPSDIPVADYALAYGSSFCSLGDKASFSLSAQQTRWAYTTKNPDISGFYNFNANSNPSLIASTADATLLQSPIKIYFSLFFKRINVSSGLYPTATTISSNSWAISFPSKL